MAAGVIILQRIKRDYVVSYNIYEPPSDRIIKQGQFIGSIKDCLHAFVLVFYPTAFYT